MSSVSPAGGFQVISAIIGNPGTILNMCENEKVEGKGISLSAESNAEMRKPVGRTVKWSLSSLSASKTIQIPDEICYKKILAAICSH